MIAALAIAGAAVAAYILIARARFRHIIGPRLAMKREEELSRYATLYSGKGADRLWADARELVASECAVSAAFWPFTIPLDALNVRVQSAAEGMDPVAREQKIEEQARRILELEKELGL